MAFRNSIKQIVKKTLGKQIYLSLRRCYILINFFICNKLSLEFYYFRIRFSRQTQRSFNISIRADSTIYPKPHILLIAEKWNAHNSDLGPTLMDWTFFGSLDASGLATYYRLNHDEHPNQYSFDKAVLDICLKRKPNCIFITSWLLSPLRFKTMKLINEKLLIPIVVVWGDSVNHMEEAESLLPFIKFNIPLESPSYYLKVTNRPEKYLPFPVTPLDPRIFHNPNIKRDIDVSFVGTMKDHPDRSAGISALRANGIEVYQSGGHEEKRLSIDEYALIYKRSKIALNFCLHPNGRVQIKGHVFEATACGAMLMEADNPDTSTLFQPLVDYVPFTDETDLVEKARYYLTHDTERLEIAARGHRKFKEKYTGEMFWKIVFKNVFA